MDSDSSDADKEENVSDKEDNDDPNPEQKISDPKGKILATFPTPKEARNYAKNNIQRYLNIGGGGSSKHVKNKYQCSVEDCEARRYVRVEAGAFVVRATGTHNHALVQAPQKRMFTDEEKEILRKLLDGVNVTPSSLQAQAKNFGVIISLETARQLVSKGVSREKISKNFPVWLETEAMDVSSGDCKVMSTYVSDDHKKWNCVISSLRMLHTPLLPDDTLVIDGNSSHIKEGPLLLLGKVTNAKRNRNHTHIPIAFGLVSTGEEAEGVSIFLKDVMRLRGQPFETNLWRLDGHSGLRNGISRAVREANEYEGNENVEAVLGMDYFHMTEAFQMNGPKLLPSKKDVSDALRDITLLMEVPIEFHLRARRAVLEMWGSRVGWERFTLYFNRTFFITLPGWWGDFLGHELRVESRGGGLKFTNNWVTKKILHD